MSRHAVFLSGPVGVGKTTLGRALAQRLAGSFLDGDDFSRVDRPWYSCILQTSRGIVSAGTEAVDRTGLVVVAYPLSRTNWIFFKRHFEDRGVRTLFVSLRATYGSIVNDRRGRAFSDHERDRIRVMIEEGYGVRPFSDLIVDTDTADFADTIAKLEGDIRRLLAR